jgi:molybdenum cofactor cytidylyltransferase
MNQKPPIIVPAAGRAERHPGKLYLELDGRPAILQTLRTIFEADLDPVVVVGHEAGPLTSLIEQEFGTGVTILLNLGYDEGMASSIRVALEALGDVDAFGIHLGDKPMVKTETFKWLLEVFTDKQPQILVPVYKKQHGHPVLFEGSLRSWLLKNRGDVGARELIAEMESHVEFVTVEDHGVILDLDSYLGA